MTSLANHPIVKMNGIGNAIAVLDLRGDSHVVSGAEALAINAIPRLWVRPADGPARSDPGRERGAPRDLQQ